MSQSAFQNLLSEFGQSSGIDGLSADKSGYCSLTFDERIIVNFLLSASGDRATIFSQLGIVDSSNSDLLTRLLSANFFWRGTDGGTLSLDPDSGAVVLARDVAIDKLNKVEFENLIKAFVASATQWADELDILLPEDTKKTEVPPTTGIRA